MSRLNDGRLVRVAGTAAVYLVVWGERCWVPNSQTFDNLFGSSTPVLEITQAELDALPVGPDVTDGAYLAAVAADPAVYLVSWGMANHVQSPDVFAQYGFSEAKITTVAPAVIAGLAAGWTLTAGSGGDTGLVPLTGSADAFYVMTEDQWDQVASRVTLVINLHSIDPNSQYPPNFPELADVCIQWRDSTFPGVIEQSARVGTLAADVAEALGKLQTELAGLGPADPLPAAVEFMYRVQFRTFADQAGAVIGDVEGASAAIDDFVAQNLAADAFLANTFGLASLTAALDTLDNALLSLQNGWDGISEQLRALSDGSVTVTTAGLLQTDVAAAQAAWNRLHDSAVAFNQYAATLN